MTYNYDKAETLDLARGICDDYASQGLRLTVRQLYYQFVARGLEDNGDKVYKRLVSILSSARLKGQFEMDLLEDRGRSVTVTNHHPQLSLSSARLATAQDLRNAPSTYLWAGRWFGQSVLPMVWVEKDALSGVFEGPCGRHQVGLFACKGYPSLQALWSFIEQVAERLQREQTHADECFAAEERGVPKQRYEEIRVLYFGDHDPDGIEIPESAERNIDDLLYYHSHNLSVEMPKITFDRVALTREQIRKHNPPPFPAKPSSSRFRKYVKRTGLFDAWELDALDPSTLRDLINTQIESLHDAAIWSTVRELVDDRRTELRSVLRSSEWIASALGDSE